MSRISLSFPEMDGGAGGISASWWREINVSVEWQDGIFFTICAVYAIVSSVALIQLIRIELRVPEYGCTTQKVFHLMNFIVNGVLAVVFGFHKQVFFHLPRLFFMLRQFPIESRGRRKKLQEVGSVTAICFTCFLIRCFVIVLSAFDSDASLDVLDHPVLNLIYYTVVEILPSALVLCILRKLPPKRVSACITQSVSLGKKKMPIMIYSQGMRFFGLEVKMKSEP